MNTKYFATLAAIVFATGFSQSITHDQATQAVLTSMFNHILVQHSPLNPSQPIELVSAPPPVNGRPDDRVPAGTRAT